MIKQSFFARLVLVGMLLISTSIFSNKVLADEVVFSPNRGATALILKTMNEAHKTIRLAGYSFTSIPIAEALVAAAKRGVDVKLVLDESQAHRRYRALDVVQRANLPLRFNKNYAIMHNKFFVVDDVRLETGSFNFTMAAEMQNAENVLILDNPQIVGRFAAEWKRLWDEAEKAD